MTRQSIRRYNISTCPDVFCSTYCKLLEFVSRVHFSQNEVLGIFWVIVLGDIPLDVGRSQAFLVNVQRLGVHIDNRQDEGV